MPVSAPHPCGSPGCPVLVGRGKTRCATHERKAEAQRGTSHERGYDARWRTARARYLKEHPLCVKCGVENRVAPATVVDHIVAHKGDQRLFWEETNWQALCKPHHDARVDEGDFGRGYSGEITMVRRVRWTRHCSATSIVRAWYLGLARAAGVAVAGFDQVERDAFTAYVEQNDGWAFSVPTTRRVHYWFRRSLSTARRVHMLGHELGHIVALPTNWRRARAPRVELSADIFGAVAALALREVAA